MISGYHTPVLVEKVIEYLVTKQDGVYVDGTIGGGGHADCILQRLSPNGKLIGFDADANAIEYTEERLKQFSNQLVLIQQNFVHMRETLNEIGIKTANGILLDLGISSFQIDQPGKGFSFQRDEPLDMRMDKRQDVNASTILRTVDEQELVQIFREYGEERHAKKIARAIIHVRSREPFETTKALASVVQRTVGGRFVKKSLARVFQALRIRVNDELNNLRVALRDIVDLIHVGGRVVVISYHSLEDRIVKEFFKAEATGSISSAFHEIKREPRLRVLTKKPITPTESEIALNRRARSAKLRVAERV